MQVMIITRKKVLAKKLPRVIILLRTVTVGSPVQSPISHLGQQRDSLLLMIVLLAVGFVMLATTIKKTATFVKLP